MVRCFAKQMDTSTYLVLLLGVQYPSEIEELHRMVEQAKHSTTPSVEGGGGELPPVLLKVVEGVRDRLEGWLSTLGGISYSTRRGTHLLEIIKSNLETSSSHKTSPQKARPGRPLKSKKSSSPSKGEFFVSTVLRTRYTTGPMNRSRDSTAHLKRLVGIASVLLHQSTLEVEEGDLMATGDLGKEGKKDRKRGRTLEIPLTITARLKRIQSR